MRSLSFVALGAVAALSLTACYGGAEAPSGDEAVGSAEQASSTAQVSVTFAQRTVLSNGNLYWSNNTDWGNHQESAFIYETPHNALTGQESALYREDFNDTTGGMSFDAVTVFDGVVYFVANYTSVAGVQSSIIAETSGGARINVINTQAYVGYGDLVNDGTSLFYADAGGIRAYTPGVGLSTLLTGTTFQHLSLDSSRVYFVDGDTIKRVPKAGGSVVTMLSTTSPINALFVRHSGTGITATTTIYWGEDGGAVRSQWFQNNIVGAVTTYQNPTSGLSVRSLSYDGSRILWGDCGSVCTVRSHLGSMTTVLATGLINAGDVQGDSTETVWTNGYIYRYTY